MKLPWKLPAGKELAGMLRQYRYVLLVAAAGLLLLLWPGGGPRQEAGDAPAQSGQGEGFSLEELEGRLEDALSRVEGAGEVSVLLTVEQGVEQVLATDQRLEQGEGTADREEETVVISGQSGEQAVVLSQRGPVFQGALVVCPGGDDPAVRLTLTQAVSALTGLGADRITVCKGS